MGIPDIVVRRARPEDADRIDEITYNAYTQAQNSTAEMYNRRSSYVCTLKGSALKRQRDAQTFVAIRPTSLPASNVSPKASPASHRSRSPENRPPPKSPVTRASKKAPPDLPPPSSRSYVPKRDVGRDLSSRMPSDCEEEDDKKTRRLRGLRGLLRKPHHRKFSESRFFGGDGFRDLPPDAVDEDIDFRRPPLPPEPTIWGPSRTSRKSATPLDNSRLMDSPGFELERSGRASTSSRVRLGANLLASEFKSTFGRLSGDSLEGLDPEEVNGTIVGCVTLAPYGCGWEVVAQQGEGELRMLAVTEKRIVATKLLERALSEAYDAGMTKVWALTPEQAAAAQALYMKIGFARVEARDFFEPKTAQNLKAFAMEEDDLAKLCSDLKRNPSPGGWSLTSSQGRNPSYERRLPSPERRAGRISPPKDFFPSRAAPPLVMAAGNQRPLRSEGGNFPILTKTRALTEEAPPVNPLFRLDDDVGDSLGPLPSEQAVDSPLAPRPSISSTESGSLGGPSFFPMSQKSRKSPNAPNRDTSASTTFSRDTSPADSCDTSVLTSSGFRYSYGASARKLPVHLPMTAMSPKPDEKSAGHKKKETRFEDVEF